MVSLVKRFWWVVAALLIGAVVIVAVVFWPGSSGGRGVPPARARVYVAWRACMVAGPAGLGDPQAAAVWMGMERVSGETSVRVSYMVAVGDGGVGSARIYLATAAGERCDLVVAVGGSQVQGVASVARQFPQTRFAVVGGEAGVGGNVSVIPADPVGGLAVAAAAAVDAAYGAGPLVMGLSAAPSSPFAQPTAVVTTTGD